ncbi:hypothetical protein K1719_042801 [Acacia pycnantha]|nr:hypothetical protein K1719_042801 [Acacia pycnantha]
MQAIVHKQATIERHEPQAEGGSDDSQRTRQRTSLRQGKVKLQSRYSFKLDRPTPHSSVASFWSPAFPRGTPLCRYKRTIIQL